VSANEFNIFPQYAFIAFNLKCKKKNSK